MPGIIEDWRELEAPAPTKRPAPSNPSTKFGGGLHEYVAFTRPLLEGEDVLHNRTTARVVIEHEKEWHRRAQELKMQGFDTKEIGAMLNKSQSYVSTVLRQDWAQERMNNRMKEDASTQIKAFLEEECLPSLVAIKEVRDSISESVRTSDRLNAAQYLTDRFLGKATQPIATVDAKPAAELTNDELNAQVQGIVAGMATAPEDIKES